ncbi:hypothetical protein [Roseovarius salinarum]|uniref:hypothetical protein n=1 Tax=Roseovarius salinarum TaxID=1981892 RepID=UPI000C33CC3A|nr:hypothetical protein [Roseovarius salinarum]
MTAACRHSLRAAGPALVAGLVLAGCRGGEEAALREGLARWFALGDTVSFESRYGCMAGVFRLTDMQVKAPLRVTDSAAAAAVALERRGATALDVPGQAPDAAIVALANTERDTGMAVRRAALEGRACMDDRAESAFRYALENPGAVLAYDAVARRVMLLDPATGLLVVVQGSR